MGGAVSCRKKTSIKTILVNPLPSRAAAPASAPAPAPAHPVSSHSFGDQIDTVFVLSALIKLSYVFELDESLTTSLTNTIVDPKHDTFQKQFAAVKKWLKKHAQHGSREVSGELSTEEIDYLIQYVELYQPLPGDDKQASPPKPEMANCLMCPFRWELASLTGDIRCQEAKRLSSSRWPNTPIDNTVSYRLSNSERHSVNRSFISPYAEVECSNGEEEKVEEKEGDMQMAIFKRGSEEKKTPESGITFSGGMNYPSSPRGFADCVSKFATDGELSGKLVDFI